MKISIIGTGYVGLVTGICLAERGHSVTAVDIDKAKIESINTGKTPIYEPGLAELLKKTIGDTFWASMDLAAAVRESELTFIAVGTPFDGKEIDLTFIRNAAISIGEALRKKSAYHVVVVKSTVVPGTTDDFVREILEAESGKKAGVDFGLGMNPEFLSEGTAVADFMRPDRLIIGGIDERTQNALAEVYGSPFFAGVPVLRTSNKTAEMIKYTSNALLATLISFSNEIARFCSDVGDIDCVEVMKGVHLSHYLYPYASPGRVRAPIASFLEAGCGFGGSCLPKDVKALIARGKASLCDMTLLKEVIKINEGQPWQMLKLLHKGLGRSLRGVPVAVLGLAFKPDTDDLRESPAFPLIDLLLASEAEVVVYDPVALKGARKRLEGRKVAYASSLEEALLRANALALVTSWKEFEQIPEMLRKLDREPVVIDGRRMLDKTKIKHYFGIGL